MVFTQLYGFLGLLDVGSRDDELLTSGSLCARQHAFKVVGMALCAIVDAAVDWICEVDAYLPFESGGQPRGYDSGLEFATYIHVSRSRIVCTRLLCSRRGGCVCRHCVELSQLKGGIDRRLRYLAKQCPRNRVSARKRERHESGIAIAEDDLPAWVILTLLYRYCQTLPPYT